MIFSYQGDSVRKMTFFLILCHLSQPARYIFCWGLGFSCWLLFCALLLLLQSLPLCVETYRYFILAAQLERMTLAIVFCTGFLGCFVEEQMLKQR